MASKVLIVQLYAGLVAAALCDKTPVLIWSPSRPLSDLSDTFVGETVDTKKFHSDYLKPLTTDSSHSLVVFLQDKLSVEDFTHHADVYNPNGDGGAFRNVKAAMDEQFSVNLPAVTAAKSAVDDLASTFKGEVIKVDDPDKIEDLDLTKDKVYFIIVTLKPISSGSEEDEYHSFQENDAMIGRCMHHMAKREVKFSAVYTAESSSQLSSEKRQGGRRLMAVDDDTQSNGTVFANKYIIMFLKSVNLTVYLKNAEQQVTDQETISFVYDEKLANATTVEAENGTLRVTVTSVDSNGTTALKLGIQQTPDKTMWESGIGNISFTGGNDHYKKFDISNMPVKFHVEAFSNYSYHCRKLVTEPVLRGYNSTTKLAVSLTLNKFQVQPLSFNGTYNGNYTFSSDVWDCVEFFTIPIWMGIIITLIIVTILFFGITMLANITTMDRFDDPKGKTITVTVNE